MTLREKSTISLLRKHTLSKLRTHKHTLLTDWNKKFNVPAAEIKQTDLGLGAFENVVLLKPCVHQAAFSYQPGSFD